MHLGEVKSRERTSRSVLPPPVRRIGILSTACPESVLLEYSVRGSQRQEQDSGANTVFGADRDVLLEEEAVFPWERVAAILTPPGR
jgi:hypothetical protein